MISFAGFMSSVDLHTHSGFQRMLPESFAVVCAPKSNPKCATTPSIFADAHVCLPSYVCSFGIFRLTDPPGLQAILGCSAKEAFHPHPDMPIYTVIHNPSTQLFLGADAVAGRG